MISEKLRTFVNRQKVGHSLEQDFYLNPEIFKLDLDTVLSRQWHYVDHISRIPKFGDYITYNFGAESIIIIRDKDDAIHAHFNVCRHRGSRICDKASGNKKKLTCPYHAWVYGANGRLEVARQMAEDFDPSAHGLIPCQIEILEGFIFVNINPLDGTDFDELARNSRSFIKPHGIPNAKIAHVQNYVIDANWKLVVENFRECYHCSPAHPQYTSVNAYVRIGDNELGGYMPTVEAWKAQNADSGKETGFKNGPYHLQPHHAWRMPIRHGYKTATQDGLPASTLMGDFIEYDGAETGIFFSPLSYFYLNNDYTTTFRINPVSPTETHVLVTWLVDQNAIEGKDYDIDNLIWLWDETTLQDRKIVNENHIGVTSSQYKPGPYSLREYGTADFTAWYLARLVGQEDQRVIFRKSG